MAEASSSPAPRLSNVLSGESAPNALNESHQSKSVVDNTKTEGREPLKAPQISSSIFGHLPGFTHFISQRNPSNPDKIFASALFASGHGHALFYPETILELDDDFRKTRGITIGDVGVLSPDNQFEFAFNVFLPADHPYNKGNTPDSFLPLSPLQESEICTTPDYFPPGYVIASKGVNVVRHSQNPLHITFSSSERRGAFMLLPEGATRHDISPTTTRVLEYVRENAELTKRVHAQI
ncbi:hypothetical protein M413DRAFT_358136 [Hebeloma cylindrosporum]|uniref:Uncharacterized protein n=1 Tax=Hebeloma cylindrosporum TaxID=76867 RepID=A0A0C2Y487_HEBCY|nr:hypothetical protein M413DRAFT_358136 [Hebeloma cylindrosporum h7]